MPAISVIIPCYNAAATIGPLVTSLVNQEGFNLEDEIIVVDDHSTDNSPTLAHQAGARLVQTPSNSGPAIARNLGVATARNDILFFLDADTLLEPGGIKLIKDHFSQPNPPPCINGYCSPQPLEHSLARDYKGLVEYSWYLQAKETNKTHSCFNTRVGAMTRQAFASTAGFDGRYGKATVEDYEFSYRLIQHHPILLKDGLTVRHDHPGFVHTSKAYWTRTQQWLALFKARKQFDSGGTSSGTALGHLLGAGVIFSLILPVILPNLALLPLILLVLFIRIFSRFFALALLERGLFFFLGCLALHLYYSLVITFAAGVGVLKLLAGRVP